MRRALAYLLFMCFALYAKAQSLLLPTPKSVATVSTKSPGDPPTSGRKVPNDFDRVLRAYLADWPSPNKHIHIGFNPTLGEEEYRINTLGAPRIEASTPTGLAWGLQSLGQLLASDPKKRLEIQDKPDVPFRCLMVDVARRYHSLSTLRVLARWCQVGKVRFIQLHLADDQNWMFPTDLLPGIDKRNNNSHPAYTKNELTDLQSYASVRGVTIIPEIDIPGHSSLLTALDPETFKLKGSPSNSCINFGSPKVREKVKSLLKEVAAVFPASPYIHIGCDEAWYQDAEKDPDVAAEMKRLNGGAPEVFIDFVAEMANAVLGLKKTPLIWEGFPASTFAKERIPKGAVIVAWDGNSYPASKLIPDGFKVVNAGMDPFYIINHYPYDLNTMVPLQRLYRADSMQFASMNGAVPFRFQDSSKVLGSMLCWWEGHEWNAQEILPQRILAFGARLWNAKGERNYASFSSRSALAMNDLNGRIRPFSYHVTGGLVSDPTRFKKSISVSVIPGMEGYDFASRVDGKSPTSADLNRTTSLALIRYNGAGASYRYADVEVPRFSPVTDSKVFTLQAFSHGNAVGETLFLPLKKVAVVPNLALNCSVTVSGDSDPQFNGSRVTNGANGDLTNYWIAYPNPQFLTIDLSKPQEIGRIEVVCYWATGDATKYRISVSEDLKTWKLVVDASKQTARSLESGYVYRFDPVKARYVRLETLGGNLYPSNMTRINQIRVFGK